MRIRMFKALLLICLSLFSFTDAGEIRLHSFKGCPGNYTPIQNLQTGKVNDDYLAAAGVQIEITEFDRSQDTLSIKVVDKKESISSIHFKPVPTDAMFKVITVTSRSTIDFSGTTFTKFATNCKPGPDAYLQVYLKNEVDADRRIFGRSISPEIGLGPCVSLFVKGDEIPMMTRYRVSLDEARDDSGVNIKKSTNLARIDRRFMWIDEGFFGKPHPDDEIRVDFYLEAPSRSATKIERISGELILRAEQTHELCPDLALGKLEHPKLTDYGVTVEVTQLDADKLELTYSDPKEKLYSIAIDPRGQKLNHFSQTTRIERGVAIFSCTTTDIPLNKGTGLTLTLINSSKEIRIPFLLKDLPLRDKDLLKRIVDFR